MVSGQCTMEGLSAEVDGLSVLDFHHAFGWGVVEAGAHLQGVAVAYNPELGEDAEQCGDGTAVVGLHVVDDEIMQRGASLAGADVRHQARDLGVLHTVNESRLFGSFHQVGVIADATRDGPEVLEEDFLPVVDTHVGYAGSYAVYVHDAGIFPNAKLRKKVEIQGRTARESLQSSAVLPDVGVGRLAFLFGRFATVSPGHGYE